MRAIRYPFKPSRLTPPSNARVGRLAAALLATQLPDGASVPSMLGDARYEEFAEAGLPQVEEVGNVPMTPVRDLAVTLSSARELMGEGGTTEFSSYPPLPMGNLRMPAHQQVSIDTVILSLESSAYRNVEVPVIQLLGTAARIADASSKRNGRPDSVPVSLDDASVMQAMTAYYASFDEGFKEAFVPDVQGKSASFEVAAYYDLAALIESVMVHGGMWRDAKGECSPITLTGLWLGMATGKAANNPVREFIVRDEAASGLTDMGLGGVSTETVSAATLEGQAVADHAHAFDLPDGTTLETIMSSTALAPYPRHWLGDGPRVSAELALAVLDGINPETPAPETTFGVAYFMMQSACLRGAGSSATRAIGEFAELVRATALKSQAERREAMRSTLIAKDKGLQSMLADMLAHERMGEDSPFDGRVNPFASVAIAGAAYRVTRESGELALQCREDARRDEALAEAFGEPVGTSWDACRDAERLGFGSYDLAPQHMAVAIAAAHEYAADTGDALDSRRDTLDATVTSVASALAEMPCAFSERLCDRSGADADELRNRFSSDLDVPQVDIKLDDAIEAVRDALGEGGVPTNALTSPTAFTVCYSLYMSEGRDAAALADGLDLEEVLGLVSVGLGGTERPEDLSNGFAKRGIKVETAGKPKGTRPTPVEDRDPFEAEGRSMPALLSLMIERLGERVTRSAEFDGCLAAGMTTAQGDAVVSLLGLMQLSVACRVLGGYANVIREYGYVTPLVWAGTSMLDTFTDARVASAEAMQEVAGGNGAYQHEARTNPFDFSRPEYEIDDDSDLQSETEGTSRGKHFAGRRKAPRSSETWNPEPYAATPTIRRYSTDMTEAALGGEYDDGLVGHEDELTRIENALGGMRRSSVLLVGPPGSGRTSVVREFARRVVAGEVPPTLLNARVYLADGTKLAEGSNAMKNVFQEAADTNTIVVLETPTEDMTRHALMSYLALSLGTTGLSIIMTATPSQTQSADFNETTTRNFVRVALKPLTIDQTIEAVRKRVGAYSSYHGVDVPDWVAPRIAAACADERGDAPTPLRELEVLDSAMAICRGRRADVIAPQDVAEAMSLLTAKPAPSASGMDASAFDDVAGQEDAKAVVTGRLAATQLGLYDARRPRSTFMFVGPSGVGKTMLASRIARFLGLDPKEDVLTLSMSEFTQSHEGARLIGSPPGYIGYERGGTLTNFVRDHHRGVVILDEIEKAHPSIVQMFLGIFDRGEVISAKGERIDCTGITFVCTSNAAFETRKAALGFATEEDLTYEERVKQVRGKLVQALGAPFVGRIDEIAVFQELGDEDIRAAMISNYDEYVTAIERRMGPGARKLLDPMLPGIIDTAMTTCRVADVGVRGVWKDVESRLTRILVDKAMAGAKGEQGDAKSKESASE